MSVRAWLPVFAMGVCAAPVAAQAPAARAWAFAVEGQASVAPSDDSGWLGGKSAGITQQAVGVRLATPLVTVGRARVLYAATLLPVMRLGRVESVLQIPNSGGDVVALQAPRAAWGAGVVPMALAADLRVAGRVRIESGVGVGAAWFSRPVPSFAARQRNFVVEWDAGVSVALTGSRALYAGLRARHLSNGYTAYENPGIDHQLVVVGVRVRR